MSKTITIQDIQEYIPIEDELVLHPGDCIDSELVNLFRQYTWHDVEKLIEPQPVRKELQKPYTFALTCSNCGCYIDDIPLLYKGEIEDKLYKPIQVFITSEGRFVDFLPGHEGTWFGGFALKMDGVGYVQVSIPVLCDDCKSKYVTDIFPEIKPQFRNQTFLRN